jgi:hypothetical protein
MNWVRLSFIGEVKKGGIVWEKPSAAVRTAYLKHAPAVEILPRGGM